MQSKRLGFLLLFAVVFFLTGCDWFATTTTTSTSTVTTTITSTGTTSSSSTSTITTESPLTIKLRSIHALAVEAGAFEGTYEEWLETVRGPQGVPGEDGKSVEMQVSGGFIEWRQEGTVPWTPLISLTALTGEPGANGQPIQLQVAAGAIQWKYASDTVWTNLIALSALTGPAGLNGLEGDDGREIELQVVADFIQWRYVGDELWKSLISLETLRGADGLDGQDAKDVSFVVMDGFIQWQYVGDDSWIPLIAIETLIGPSGTNGTNGEDGLDGKPVVLLVMDGYIQWQYEGDATWTPLIALSALIGPAGSDGTDGQNGTDGKEIQLQVIDGFIQWQYVGGDIWTPLIALSELIGPIGPSGLAGTDGREVSIRVADGYIQWQYVGDTLWNNLISLSSLIGAQGPQGEAGEDGLPVQMQVAEGYVQWQYVGDTVWNNLISLSSLMGPQGVQGEAGSDGEPVQIQVAGGYIQWKYESDLEWTNMIAIASLIGPQGNLGLPGEAGTDGKEVVLQVAEGFIQWKYVGDATWTNLISMASLIGAQGPQGDPGVDGKEVQMQVSGGYIQWKYIGDITWNNLVALSSLIGPQGVQGEAGTDGKEVQFQVAGGSIQWKYVGDIFWNNLVSLSSLIGPQGVQGVPGMDGEEVQMQVSGGYIQWKYLSDTLWNNLVSLSSLIGPQGVQGETGTDGKEVLLQVAEGFIQWKYVGDATWNNLVSMASLIGAQGPQGEAGTDGEEVQMQVSGGYIQWKYADELVWTNMIALTSLYGPKGDQGDAGTDGKEVLMQIGDGFIQWKYVGDVTWNNLVSLASLIGPQGVQGEPGMDGKEVLLQVSGGYIQWQYTGDSSWTNLIAVESLVGETGNGIQSMTINAVGELVVTYTSGSTVNLGQILKVYVVTFLDFDGSVAKIQLVVHSQNATPPVLTNPEGHTFVEWSGTITNITADTTITSVFSVHTYTITFDSQGGTASDPLTNVPYGTTVTLPLPTKEGFGFLGWYAGSDVNAPKVDSATPIKGNVTLYARWTTNGYTVRFLTYDSQVLSMQWILHGYSAIAPAVPSRIGYVVIGWSDSFLSITEDIDIIAEYTPIPYTISFVENGGPVVEDITQGYETAVVAPANPIRTGYTFGGWHSDPELSVPYVFSTMPLNGLTLYAKWTINSYTIAFDENEGSVVEDITQQYNTAVAAPADPTRTGHTFQGWYTSEDWTEAYVFGTMPAYDQTIHAKWQINSYTIAFVENGGSEVSDITQEYMTSVLAPADPTKTGHTFAGWYSDIDLTIPYVFTTMPLHGILLYAKWTIYSYTITYHSIDDLDIALISTHFQTIIVTEDGRVLTIGYNAHGELGSGDTVTSNVLLDITAAFSFATGETVVKVVADSYCSFLLTSQGRLFAWGRNLFGQIGNGTRDDQLVPLDVTPYLSLASGEVIDRFFTDGNRVHAITSNERIFVWGNYLNGVSLSGVSSTSEPTPTDVTASVSLLPGETIREIEYGFDFMIVLTSNNRILTVGRNDHGQLGNGTTTYAYDLIDISSQFTLNAGETILKLETMWAGSAGFLTSNGRLFLWGSNTTYNVWSYSVPFSLANGLRTDVLVPTDMTAYFNLAAGETIKDIQGQFASMIVLTSANRVLSFGWNRQGNLGDGTTTSSLSPVDVSAAIVLDADETILHLNPGDMENITLLTSKGRLFGWGYNLYYSLFSPNANRLTPTNLWPTTMTIHAQAIHDYDTLLPSVADPVRPGYVFDGWYHDPEGTFPLVITNMPAADVTLYAKWAAAMYTISFDTNGGTDVNALAAPYLSPITKPEDPTQQGYTFLGWYADEALTTPFVFNYMHLGNRTAYAKWTTNEYLLYFLSKEELEMNFMSIGSHSVFVSEDNRVYTSGYNSYGALGNNTTMSSSVLVDITDRFEFALDETPKQVWAARNNGSSFLLTTSGRLFAWGFNSLGILGTGTESVHVYVPTEITSRFALMGGETIEEIFIGSNRGFALTSLHRVFAWGWNGLGGMLFANSTTPNVATTPIVVTASFNLQEGEHIVQIATGEGHSIARSNFNRLFAVGYNNQGPLGNGTTNLSSIVLDVTSFLNLQSGEAIVSIDAGDDFSGVLTSLGRLLLWGANGYYQLGDETTINRLSPIDVTPKFELNPGEVIVAMKLNRYTGTAFTNQNRLFTWGEGNYNEIGDGTTVDKPFATNITQFLKLYDGESIDSFVSFEHATLALKTSQNRILAWGYNLYGGIPGSFTNKTTPTPIVFTSEYLYTTLSFDYQETIVFPSDPIRVGHTFAGWYEDPEYTTPWEIMTMPWVDRVLFAKWQINNYTYTYDSNGGSAVTTTTLPYLTVISSPMPTKEGHTFAGWYEDPELTIPYRFVTVGLRNVTLYAKWTPNTYLIQYDTDPATMNFMTIDGGIRHGVALTTSHQVFAWGSGTYGQVGNNSTTDTTTPYDITPFFRLVGDETIAQVVAGDYHNIALSSTGRVFTWGYGLRGQLGTGNTANQLMPVDITANFRLNGDTVIRVFAGNNNTFATTQQGKVFSFGYNNNYLVGNATLINRVLPLDITSRFNLQAGETVTQIEVGSMSAAALTSLSRIFTWGSPGSTGTLASGASTYPYPFNVTSHFNLASGETVTNMRLGSLHGIVSTSLGRVITWGYNNAGQLGDNTTATKMTPIDITASFAFASGETPLWVGASYDSTQVVTTSGRVFGFGSNYYGQIGFPDNPSRLVPTETTSFFALPSGETIAKIEMVANYYTSYAVTNTGRYVGYGYNGYYNLGTNTTTNVFAPTAYAVSGWTYWKSQPIVYGASIETLTPYKAECIFEGWYTDKNLTTRYTGTTMGPVNVVLYAKWIPSTFLAESFQSISASTFNLALTKGNNVYAWGSNAYAQLGNQLTVDLNVPTLVTTQLGLSEQEKVTAVHTGNDFALIQTSYGRILTWGRNEFGQLGNGTTTNSSTAVDITANFGFLPGETVTHVGLGNSYAFLVTSNQRIFSWGDGAYGKLASGSTAAVLTPQDVSDHFSFNEEETVHSIGIGTNTAMLLTSDHRVFCWGSNYWGNHGMGDFDAAGMTNVLPVDKTPTGILTSGETVSDIVLGHAFTLLLTSNGRLFSTGINYEGQLARGTFNWRYTSWGEITPALGLASGETIASVHVSEAHSVLETSLGRILTWGINTHGQLGNGETANRNLPVDITAHLALGSGETVRSIVSGDEHTVVITSSNRMIVWGKNDSGQLGDGTFVDKTLPVAIQ